MQGQMLNDLPRACGLTCLQTIERIFCGRFIWLLQLQSCLTLMAITIAWFWSSFSRLREANRIRRQQAKGHVLAFVDPDERYFSHQVQASLPQVTVILAVKGVGAQGVLNWKSQLVTMYGGKVEFLFCVESKEDPAFAAVQVLQKEMGGSSTIRLVVAGLATECSQQIHNQLAGAKSASEDSKYILFLDDDIQCHPGSIGALVKAMETDPKLFVCTGYSFDMPSSPSLAAYAAMSYRLPLLVGMSGGGPGFFVWGGCIMIRADDFRENRHGMQTALSNHGYSNDLILTSVAAQHQRQVWCPAVAIFPGRMSGDWSMLRYWNYVRRQIFALLTYCSPHARRTNLFGWITYTYFAPAAGIPLVISFLHLSLAALSLLYSFLLWANGNQVSALLPAPATFTQWAAGHSPCLSGLLMSVVNLACAAVTGLSLWRLFHSVLSLCNLLSPHQPQLKLEDLSLSLCILGMLTNFTLMPIISLYTFLRPDISWARIKYVRRNGMVAKVVHPVSKIEALVADLEAGCLSSPEKRLLQNAAFRMWSAKGMPSLVSEVSSQLLLLLGKGSPSGKKVG